MKHVILVVIVMLFTIAASAQVKNEDLAIIQAYFQKDKADLVRQELTLSETQSSAFWPLYETYESKRLALSSQRAIIINDYIKGYETVTDDEASNLANRLFANDDSYTTLEKDYFKKFSKIMGGKNTARLYQLEHYLREIIRLRVQNEIPFINQLGRVKP